MAYDFRANQIRLNRIISSGSVPIYIYPSGSATNLQGGVNFSTASIGTDVFLFVSGSSNAITLFGGNVVSSGSVAAIYVSSSTGARITGSMTNGAPGVVAFGLNSHAEGDSTTAVGQASHAEGSNTGAGGDYAHSEGLYSQAVGAYSHAEGQIASATGFASHAEGLLTLAIGNNSHAEGIGSEAYGTGSLAAGLYTVASGAVDGTSPTTTQAAFGKYNLRDNVDSLFVVGDGLDDSNRHDILRVNSGSVQVTGSLIASTITGSISGTVAGNPFIVAGANITTTYNSLGQWEITSSAAGSNIWLELDASTIYTTSSVRVAGLSASFGAIITGSVVQGTGGIATGQYSHSEGYEADVTGNYGHAEGYQTDVTGIAGHAEGNSTTAAGDYSHAEGINTNANGNYSHAEGRETLAAGEGSHAEGRETQANGDYSLAVGTGSIAAGNYSFAAGNKTEAFADYQTVVGKFNITSNSDSLFVVGDGLDVSNRNDVLRVNSGSVGITGSFTQGSNLSATGQYSHAEGLNNTASGYASHAEGVGNTASNFYAHAEGANTTASGLYTHAEGQVTIASGQAAHAEGYATAASGDASHSEGYYTTASGLYSHAEGSGSIASGKFAHAEGITTLAIGTGSFAAGLQTISYGSIDGTDPPTIIQAAFGKYNLDFNADSLFVVGDGLDGSNRHDVLRVNSGSVQVTGSFKVSGSTVVFDYNGLFPNEITLQNANTGDELYLTTSSIGYVNGITPDKFLITSDGVLEISSNVSRISLNSNSEITGSLDVLGEINVYSGSIVPGLVIQPNTDGTGSIDILFDKDLSGTSVINMRPLYVTMSTDSNSGILLSGSLLTSKLTTSTIGKIDFNILAIASTTDDYASWLFSTTMVQDSTNTVKLLVASELDSVFSGSNATTWDVNISSNGNVYCTGSNAATVHWYAQVTKKMIFSGSGAIVY